MKQHVACERARLGACHLSPFDSTRAANAISARAAFVFNVYLVIQAKEENHVVHVPASNGAGIDLTCPLRCEVCFLCQDDCKVTCSLMLPCGSPETAA